MRYYIKHDGKHTADSNLLRSLYTTLAYNSLCLYTYYVFKSHCYFLRNFP